MKTALRCALVMIFGWVLAVALGCSTSTPAFAPVDAPRASFGNAGGHSFSIPPEDPEGEVDVRSDGILKLRTPSGLARAIQVRMIVVNRSKSSPWVIDVNHLRVSMLKQGSSRPTYVNLFRNQGSLPEVKIPPGQAKTFDLYYELPRGLQNSAEIPSFAFSWDVVIRGGRTIFKVLSFGKYTVPKSVPQIAVSGNAPIYAINNWWANPEAGWTLNNPAPPIGVGPSVVNTSPLNEATLVPAVRTALQARPRLDTSTIRIYSHQPGVVILGGSVPSYSQKQKAVDTAERTLGVERVVDRIRVHPATSSPDVALDSQIDHRINEDPRIGPDAVIDAKSAAGHVDLGGVVESWEEAHRATHDAFLAGAKTVDSRIRVRQNPILSSRARYYTKDPFYS